MSIKSLTIPELGGETMNHKERKTISGRPLGSFIISIDDGFVEYAYEFHFLHPTSIDSILRKICRKLKKKPVKATLRTRYVNDPN